ncbi:MAG: hypothetical protein WBI07_02690 [Mobilitalea sp.]
MDINNNILGYLGLFLGCSNISWQLYLLPFLQKLDFLSMGQSYNSPSSYMYEFPVNISLLLSVVMIVMGIVLIIRKEKL